MESTPAIKLSGKRCAPHEEEEEESDGGETETRILIDQALVNTVEDPEEEETAETPPNDFRLETDEALEDDADDVDAEPFMPQLDTLDAADDDAEAPVTEIILLDELAPMSWLEDEPADVSGEDPALIEIPRALPDEEDGADDEPDRDLVIEPLLDSCAEQAAP